MTVPSTSTEPRPSGQGLGQRPSVPDPERVAGRETARPVRILLVDDSAAVRESLRQMLELTGRVLVVGEAADGEDAVHQAARLGPDVVLLDLEMPVLGGLEAAPRLRSLCPSLRLVALTVHASDKRRRAAAAAGFDDYVVKGSPMAALLDAVTGVRDMRTHDTETPIRKEKS